ncbi:hypothetical protein [Pyxidicoccus sp. MSG2]|uniref:hypothetical protein n=1 Tax=Pyxidicoccus sp. MSG2 TaxID=2996790 RepID=UPI0022704666|nr:hypothetical protein [Pyxidicoccus sp. MSG2]MCY1018092.1 hypothetical protein [Pyxidicoccus sp. MSG2]
MAMLLASCVRTPSRRTAPSEEDLSIVFPNFHEQGATRVSVEGQPYELDGAVLQALAMAANDFLPPDARGKSCWNRQASYRYRVIKQDGLIFVDISADPGACQPGPRMLDGGVKYAISPDGRILRRLFDGEPEALPPPEGTDAGLPETSPEPSIPVGDTTWGEPQPLPLQWLDGGT